jgi:phosphopantetheine--protein transferase-like protein
VVGNDVVDLDDEDNLASQENPRFAERVCAPAELERLEAAEDRGSLLWSLFAAKEAAYKAVCKLGPRPVLGHRSFLVAPDLRRVEHHGRVLKLHVAVAASFVHAVVTTGDEPALSRVSELRHGRLPGEGARRLLVGSAAAILGAEPKDLAVVRPHGAGSWDGRGPPVLLRDGRRCRLDVSLSHDGRYVACAAC